MIKDLLAEYTDDTNLVEAIDLLLRFSLVENEAELVSYPMEYFINLPGITIEMCQLINEIQQKENIKIHEWAQKPENAEFINSCRENERFYSHLLDEYKKELENEASIPEYC